MQDAGAFLSGTRAFVREMHPHRAERQARRHLDPADFERLREIGFLQASVPVAHGGLWESSRSSNRALSDAHRILAIGDPSLALAASMHPGVLAFWRDTAAPSHGGDAWEEQRRAVFDSALHGEWWGTITSEAGSGGDIAKTRATARRDGKAAGGWRITGEKHFGSGASVTSCMITGAVPEGEAELAWFYVRIRNVPWDGSAGFALRAEWDGHGMAGTDSHAFTLTDFPATRFAWPDSWRQVIEGTGGTTTMFQVAVIVGVVDAAMGYTQTLLRSRGSDTLTPYEKVEWVAAEREAWLVRQAYDAGLRALEIHGRARLEASMAKANIAILAESVLTRLCRVAGGGSYSRRSPLGQWFEDVRAMGFLRPPWSIASDALFAMGWSNEPYCIPV